MFFLYLSFICRAGHEFKIKKTVIQVILKLVLCSLFDDYMKLGYVNLSSVSPNQQYFKK